MLQTNTPSNRVSVAEDALAAFGLTVMNARSARQDKRVARAMARAERRADRAARLALRGLTVAEPPRA
ncbi:MAG TPA: hypothetical protein VGH30_07455 [Jatrophihabitantaceae bacterium]|jgi:phytoene/squalene synthetase